MQAEVHTQSCDAVLAESAWKAHLVFLHSKTALQDDLR